MIGVLHGDDIEARAISMRVARSSDRMSSLDSDMTGVFIRDFLDTYGDLARQRPEAVWLRAIEVLIHRLDELLDDCERLEQELAAALDDLITASKIGLS